MFYHWIIALHLEVAFAFRTDDRRLFIFDVLDFKESSQVLFTTDAGGCVRFVRSHIPELFR